MTQPLHAENESNDLAAAGDSQPDRWAYERSLLRYMLTARRADGEPLVWAETLLRQFLDDISVRHTVATTTTTADLYAWAMNRIGGCTHYPHCLCFQIWQSYRVMVGAMSYGYHPDWLCAPVSPANGSPEFSAWDRYGRRVV